MAQRRQLSSGGSRGRGPRLGVRPLPTQPEAPLLQQIGDAFQSAFMTCRGRARTVRSAMSTTCFAHAALSAAAVGVLLSMLRRAGPRAIGLAAAIPVNSMPALFWLSLERGSAYASSAALGTLWGTGLTVLLGASFARLASALHPAGAGLLAWLGVGALAVATTSLSSTPAVAAALTICAILVGRAALPPAPAHDPARRSAGRSAALLSMAAAAAMSLVVSGLSRYSGPQLCGLVAAIPVVGMFTLNAGYRRGGAPLMLRVLHGYLDGMAAKAAFLGALGCSWALGAGAAGWGIGVACATLTLRAQHRHGQRNRDRAAHRQAALPVDKAIV